MPFVIKRKSTGLYFTDSAQWRIRRNDESWSSDINAARIYKTETGAKASRATHLPDKVWEHIYTDVPDLSERLGELQKLRDARRSDLEIVEVKLGK